MFFRVWGVCDVFVFVLILVWGLKSWGDLIGFLERLWMVNGWGVIFLRLCFFCIKLVFDGICRKGFKLILNVLSLENVFVLLIWLNIWWIGILREIIFLI